MIADKILQYLSKNNLPWKEEKTHAPVSASSSGKCPRQIAYRYHGYEARPLNARAKLVFDLGDTIEDQLSKILLSQSFVDEHGLGFSDQQKEVSVMIAGQKITGHIDGIINGDTVVDFKSINTRGFSKIFKPTKAQQASDEDPIGDYRYQMNFYMHCLGFEKAIIVYYNKDTSHIDEHKISYDKDIWKQIETNLTKVLTSSKKNLPERKYQPGSKGNLPWQCSYCDFCSHCYPDYVVNFDLSGKPTLKKG